MLDLVVAGYFWGALYWRMSGCVFVLTNGTFQVFQCISHRRRARSQVCRAVSGALTRIAERHPSPQLPADRVYQDQHARQATREAAQRIDLLTQKLKSLPLSSNPAAADPGSLPVAAAEPRGRH
jgi:hypothetical protein